MTILIVRIIILKSNADVSFPLDRCSTQVLFGAHDQKRPMMVVFDSGETHSDSPPAAEVEQVIFYIYIEHDEPNIV